MAITKLIKLTRENSLPTKIDERAPVYAKSFNLVLDVIEEISVALDDLTDGTISTTAIALSGALTTSLTTDSTTKDTGSIITEGGIGVEKAIVTGTSITAGTNIIVSGTTDATTSTTGSLKTAGGLGVAKAGFFGTSVNAGTYVTSGNGTVSLPALGPIADVDTGIYFPSANIIGIAVGGVKQIEVNPSGAGVVGYFVKGQIAPTNSNVDPAVKATMATSMLNGILTATPAAAINYTLPTGTEMQTAAGTTIDINQSIDFSIINIGAGGIITFVAAAAFTIVGIATVAAATSVNFRIQKTAANTFVLYRMS